MKSYGYHFKSLLLWSTLLRKKTFPNFLLLIMSKISLCERARKRHRHRLCSLYTGISKNRLDIGYRSFHESGSMTGLLIGNLCCNFGSSQTGLVSVPSSSISAHTNLLCSHFSSLLRCIPVRYSTNVAAVTFLCRLCMNISVRLIPSNTGLGSGKTQLHAVFNTLQGKNICLSPKKSFLGYPSVQLLGQSGRSRNGYRRRQACRYNKAKTSNLVEAAPDVPRAHRISPTLCGPLRADHQTFYIPNDSVTSLISGEMGIRADFVRLETDKMSSSSRNEALDLGQRQGPYICY